MKTILHYRPTLLQSLWNTGLTALGFVILLGVMFAPSYVEADGYNIKLFYESETQTLRKDRFANQVISFDETIDITYYDILEEQTPSDYKVEFISTQGPLPNTMPFSPQKGAFSIEAPYLPHVQTLNILNPQGKKLISFDVSKFSKCNQNNVCEYENGENQDTCIADCTAPQNAEVQFSEQTKQKLRSQNGVIRNEEGTVLLENNDVNADDSNNETIDPSDGTSSNIWILVGGVLLISVAIGIWVYLTFFRDEE